MYALTQNRSKNELKKGEKKEKEKRKKERKLISCA
jgi:hypothetical protein